VETPAPKYDPGEQVLMHVAAQAPENFPKSQSLHIAAVAPEYFPATQLVHADPDTETFPAVQSEHSLLPVELDFPAGHAVHAAENDVVDPLRSDQPSVSRAYPDSGEPM
jgi:hypothetical protein